ncbi:MAG: hypothetical protein KGI71_04530 [Patescibacteria group bacterium]|nr:hypothetical protein [Patescibacteria group bacterium]
MFLVASLLVGTPVAYYFGSIAQFNADQAQIYALQVQAGNQALSQGVFARQVSNGSCQGSNCSLASAQTLEYSETLHMAGHLSFSRLFADTSLIAQGYTPDCQAWCFQGINYYRDPSGTIPNDGRDFTSCKQFGASNTITCTAADFSKFVYLSSSATAPAATDTFAAGPCATGNILTTNGADGGAGTVTIGAIGTTQTNTVALTFSFTGAATVNAACLLTEVRTGVNVIVFGEGTIGPFTFANGDSLTETFSDAET